MYSSGNIRRWTLLKYKKLKSEVDPVENEISMSIDPSQRQLIVYSQHREKEKVTFSSNNEDFPKFRVNNLNVYVMFNSKFEGFRLSFRQEDRNEIVHWLRRFEPSLKTAAPARNVSVHNPYAASPSTQAHSSISLSQSSYNPRSQSVPNPNSSVQCTQFAHPNYPPPSEQHLYARQNMNKNYSFREYVVSPSGSIPSISGLTYTNLSTPSPLPNFSQSSQFQAPSLPKRARLSRATPRVERVDKSVQTDDLVEKARENSEFMKKCIRDMMKNDKFCALVKTARSRIKGSSEEERHRIFKKFEIRKDEEEAVQLSQDPSIPSTSQSTPPDAYPNSPAQFNDFFSLREL